MPTRSYLCEQCKIRYPVTIDTSKCLKCGGPTKPTHLTYHVNWKEAVGEIPYDYGIHPLGARINMAQNKQFINTAQLQEWGYDSPKIGDIVKFNDRFWELESKKDDLWWVRAIVVEEIFKSLPTLPENPKSGG